MAIDNADSDHNDEDRRQSVQFDDPTIADASSQQHSDAPPSCPSSSLESLPAELRDKVLLHIPDLPTLRSLTHASPVMHAQYRSNRDRLLRACLERELDGFFVDAYACVMSRVDVLGRVRTDEKITAFCESYRGWLKSSGRRPDVHSTSAGYVRWLAAFHVRVARPLARRYSTWALANLTKATSSSADQDTDRTSTGSTATATPIRTATATAAAGDRDMSLSRSEEIRIFRALYRYETFCHLFGRNRGSRRGGFRHHMVNEVFFCLFDPWEAEAVGCIDLFLRQKYEDIFAEVKEHLHPDNPKFMQPNGVLNPEGSIDLDIEYEDYLDGTVSRGLKMAVRLFAISDHDTLVAKMERAVTRHHHVDATMKKALWSVAQEDRRTMSDTTNLRDEAEQRRDAMQFDGDAVPPDGPPLAWVLLWNETYSNIYGSYVPPTVQSWGYVMWDERRWTELGAQDLVYQQWETHPQLVEEIGTDYGWAPADY